MPTTHAEANVIGRLPRITEPALVSEAVRKALEQGQPLVVLRAARGFGKTNALVSWLRSYREAATAVYYPLDTSSNDVEGFWAGLALVLHRAGLAPEPAPAAEGRSTRAHVLGTITDLTKPLRLVLDNYHEAGLHSGETQIDNDLIELIRNNDHVSVVAAGRTLRTLETVGCLSVDASIIGPAELALRPEQVRDLAAMAGLNLSHQQAVQVTDDLGGWPAAIRVGLRGMTADGTVDDQLVRGYVGAVIADLRFEEVRTFLLRTAVPDSFDLDMLRAITPSDQDGVADCATVLGRLRSAGMLREESTADGVRYRHPAAIRRALLHAMRESAPEIGRQVHRALLAAPGTHYDPGTALTHAVSAQEWSIALDIIDRQWFQLLTESSPTLVDAVRRMPSQYGDHDPRIRVARRHLGAIVERYSTGDTWFVPESQLSSSAVINAARGAIEPADQESLILVQWGVAAMLSGNRDAAIYAFSQARELGLGRGTLATRLGASGLALVHALTGEVDLARAALQDASLREYQDSIDAVDPADLAGIAVRMAQAFVAVDAGDPDAAVRVAGVVDPRHRTELWVVAEFVRGHYAVFADDPEEVFRGANRVRAALRHIARNTLADTVLQSTLVELLLVARMVGVAGEVAEQFGDNAIAWVAQAKVQHARQNYEQTVQLARRALPTPGLSQRSQLECAVILASALHAMNASSEAEQAFHQAVRISRATGQRRPFQLMHRYVFDMLAEHVPLAHGLWPGTAAQTAPAEADPEVELPTLTMREAQVLRALERHAGPVGIGRSLHLSVNTVKTHLRSVYRKLGVASRNEALDVAGRGSLQAPDSH